jgi:hypothetical protein
MAPCGASLFAKTSAFSGRSPTRTVLPTGWSVAALNFMAPAISTLSRPFGHEPDQQVAAKAEAQLEHLADL